jgi:hypothetical protein
VYIANLETGDFGSSGGGDVDSEFEVMRKRKNLNDDGTPQN